jgi:TRAP transporter TAXI family solute receptor
VSNLKELQQGSADCAFSYADVAYDAVAGRLPDERAPLDRLRGVALVQLSPLYFLVLRDSPIHGVPDLRSRTVALRSRDSGSLQAAMLVLEAFGLGASEINIQSESFTGSFARLLDGSVDALFILTSQPSDSISQAVASRARIVALAGPPIDRLRERYPFLRPTLILANSYPGHPAPIRTVGVESVLLCRADLPAARVYEMTRTWFLTANQSSADGPMSGPISPARAAATPIPLHPGAARYYRERQLLP